MVILFRKTGMNSAARDMNIRNVNGLAVLKI